MKNLAMQDFAINDLDLAIAIYNERNDPIFSNKFFNELVNQKPESLSKDIKNIFEKINNKQIDSLITSNDFEKLIYSDRVGTCRLTKKLKANQTHILIKQLTPDEKWFFDYETISRVINQLPEHICVYSDSYEYILGNRKQFPLSHEQIVEALKITPSDKYPLEINNSVKIKKIDTHILGKSFYYIASRDNTEINSLEETIKINQGYLNYARKTWGSLVEHNHSLILVTDSDGVINFSNRGFLNRSTLDLIGTPLHDIVSDFDKKKIESLLRKIISGEIEHETIEACLTFSDQQSFDCRWLANALPRQDNTMGATWIITDIGDEKAMRERALAAEKHVATGRMAARIAHEINNPLAGINSAMALIKMDTPAESPSFKYIDMVEKEIHRLSAIIRQMYGLYTPSSESTNQVCLKQLLDTTCVLMKPLAEEKNVTLSLGDYPNLDVLVCENRVREIIYNLLKNAIEASSENSRIEVSAHIENDQLVFVIDDEGCGIKENFDKLFEPFFTTKQTFKGKGLGLGLAISRSLANAMGGDIQLTPKADVGTKAKLLLPLKLNTAAVT